jgi:hypothetical protein
MKLFYPLFLLVTLGLLLNNVSSTKRPLLTANELCEVKRRLNFISNL